MSKTCQHCGQEIKDGHKEKMSKHKLMMLKECAKHVIETGRNDFSLTKISGNKSGYTNWQKLRYHGLITNVKRDGMKVRGHWLITRNGWAFLRGELNVHKWLIIRDNHIIERSPELVNIRDVFRGSEIIETTFEYFDEHGNMIGIRPTPRHVINNQIRLSL